jgi:hypothetical protein
VTAEQPTPPVRDVRKALQLVADGRLDHYPDPDAAVMGQRREIARALVWAQGRGLLDQDELKLTDMGRGYLEIIGGRP